MTTEPILPLHIDSTMRSCFSSCPQKFYNEFVLGLRPSAPSIDLHAGACFALALETFYRAIHLSNRPVDDALAVAFAEYTKAWSNFEIPAYKKTAKTFDRVWEAVEDYVKHYGAKSDHVQPYFASDGKPTFEYTFAIPLEPVEPTEFISTKQHFYHNYRTQKTFPVHPNGSPFIYCGRFDMLGNYASRPCVRDEKTTGGSIGTAWPDQWNLRGQFLGYVWACQQAGIDLDTVVVRGIAIQKTQIVHAEAVKQYANFMLDRWLEQLRRDLWRIRRCWDEQYWDYNFGESCTAYGGCLYAPLCQSPQPERWHDDFTISRWNPLKKNPVEEAVDGH